MKTIRKLAALLILLCLLAGLCACSLDEQDAASLIQLIQTAAENIESAAENIESAAEDIESAAPGESAPAEAPGPEAALDPEGEYTSREDVALYLHLYGELPRNFLTKDEARALGWTGGGLDDYAYGMCIGGDRFGNYEGILPPGNYRECDIDTLHARGRGAKRLVYADDGRIYYTEDHYESFTLLYGEE